MLRKIGLAGGLTGRMICESSGNGIDVISLWALSRIDEAMLAFFVILLVHSHPYETSAVKCF